MSQSMQSKQFSIEDTTEREINNHQNGFSLYKSMWNLDGQLELKVPISLGIIERHKLLIGIGNNEMFSVI